MSKKVRIIHIPSSVGGNPQGLSRHLTFLGYNSESWILEQNLFGYPADKVICNKSDRFIIYQLKKLWALRYVFISDVAFFNFGSTLFTAYPSNQKLGFTVWLRMFTVVYRGYTKLMNAIELTILRWRKVLLLIQYQGNDARQGDYCLKNYDISIAGHVKGNKYYSPESDDLKRKKIKLFGEICFKIYALNPDLLNVLPNKAEFLPYSHISLKEWLPNYNQDENRPLRIGHAPSHRGAKGTEVVINIVNHLKTQGYNFEFVLIEGLDNKSAKEKYKSLDVLIDQLYAGWYGGLAVECMALGKPILAYIRESDLRYIPEQMRLDLPVINITISSLEDRLRELLEMDYINLLELAKRSRAYVEKWHDPMVIAKRVASDIEMGLKERKS